MDTKAWKTMLLAQGHTLARTEYCPELSITTALHHPAQSIRQCFLRLEWQGIWESASTFSGDSSRLCLSPNFSHKEHNSKNSSFHHTRTNKQAYWSGLDLQFHISAKQPFWGWNHWLSGSWVELHFPGIELVSPHTWSWDTNYSLQLKLPHNTVTAVANSHPCACVPDTLHSQLI